MNPATDLPDPDDAEEARMLDVVPAADGSGSSEEMLLDSDLHGTRESLVRLLEQGQREASAGRAQARELIRAVDRLQATHEFLGTELRLERRRGRRLLVLLVLLPLLAVAVAWLTVIEARRAGEDLAAAVREASGRPVIVETAAAPVPPDPRVAELESALSGLRTDLEAARAAREVGDAVLAEHPRRLDDLESRLQEAERDLGQLPGLRAQLRDSRERTGAEAARSDALERELEDLRRDLAAARAEAGPSAAAGQEPPTFESEPAPVAAAVTAPDPDGGALREGGELDRIRGGLNDLLAASPGAVVYAFESLGGVSGVRLVDLVLVGRDTGGRVVRRIEAPSGRVVVERSRSRVLLRFSDGHLVVGTVRAPFFDGSYALVLDAEPGPWLDSGLTCVSYD